MLKIHKLDHVGLVPLALQHGGTDGVGQQSGDPLFDDPVLQQQIQISALSDGEIDLMLAAGHGEDVPDFSPDGIGQGEVRGHIAGVEGDHHVDGGVREGVLCYVRHLKAQALIAVAPGNFIAVFDHVRLEIIADDMGVQTALDGEVVVEDEGQIGLAAAEIQDADFSLPVLLPALGHQLHEAVDLLELVVAGADDLVVFGKHAQIHQRRDGLPLPEDVFLLPVVGLLPAGARHGRLGGGPLVAAVPT